MHIFRVDKVSGRHPPHRGGFWGHTQKFSKVDDIHFLSGSLKMVRGAYCCHVDSIVTLPPCPAGYSSDYSHMKIRVETGERGKGRYGLV